MSRFALLLLLAAASGAQAQEAEIQRALVQRDQQSADFATGIHGPNQALHQRQLLEVMTVPVQPELRPYQRQRMADERVLTLPPPQPRSSLLEKPLPLPGGPRRGVDPVLPQGFAG